MDSLELSQAKDLFIQTHVKELKAEHSDWTNQRAYAQVVRDHPELFEDSPTSPEPRLHLTDKPAFATQGYRYTPDARHPKSHIDSLRTILQDAGVWPAVQRIAATEKLDPQTAELLYGGPVKVEATPESEYKRPSKKGAMLVYGGGIPLF
jgi:hypothetical protein